MKNQPHSHKSEIFTDSLRKEDLIRQYLPLVRTAMKIVSRETGLRTDNIELFENGVLGLVQALKTYRYDDRMPFMEYALHHIREYMKKSLPHCRRRDERKNFELLQFGQIEEREIMPEETEIPGEIAEPSGKAHDVMSFDQDPLTALLNDENRRMIEIALNRLPYAEKDVLRMTFYENLSPAHIAGRLGINASEVSALRSAGLRRLRRYILMHH